MYNNNNDYSNEGGFVNLRDYKRPKDDSITPGMRKRQEELNSWISPQELMRMNVLFVEEYYDTRSKNGIVKGPRGTFYLNVEDVPEGLPTIPAKFSYTYGGEHTATYRGLYINVDDGNSGNSQEGTREFEDSEVAFRVYNYLGQLGREVELNGNKIYVFKDRLLVDLEIDKFMSTYARSKADVDREKRRKTNQLRMEEEIIDDDYVFE